ncbi:MAG TPA: hypothetical protein VK444_02955 [Methanobacteriaceae archaeon]|nr:hypothetical protein [Methanobacteriaceae archaeon]
MIEWKSYAKYAFAIPALVAFVLALIPTLKYQWPLSWDIIYHIQYAKIYAQYGLVLTDPLLNAPFGQKIAYPPLFHFIIAGLGNLFHADYFQVAKYLQPILAGLLVLTSSYVGYKFYGKIVGLSAGFLLISSYIFTRIILPIPENLALIFLPLAVYLYYISIKNKNLKAGVLAGILFVITALSHLLAPLCLFIIITSISLVELIFYRNIGVFKNYAAFLLASILSLALGALGLLIVAPDLFQSVLNQGIGGVTGIATSIYQNRPLGLLGYLKNIGPILCIFAVAGGIIAIKKHEKKDVFLMVWIISMILLSVAYLIGINVISYRAIIYILIPLSILGGLGINTIYHKLKDYPQTSSKQFRCGFLVAILVLSTFTGFLTVDNPKISYFGVKNDFGTIQIAPPSSSEVDLAQWFQKNGNKSRSILISNQFTGMFLATQTGMPMHYSFELYSLKNSPNATLDTMKAEKIGYIVYDKNLVLSPPDNSNLFIKPVLGEFYPLYYISQDIQKNINQIKPDYTQIVYENQDFIVLKIIYS